MRYPWSFYLILLLSVVLLFIKLGSVTVFQIAEARNSQAVAEMMVNRDYITPHFNGALRTDKPPLHYYSILLAYTIGGISETGARFFSAVCGVLVIMATWLFSRKYAGVQTAWFSSLVLLGSIHAIFQFRLAAPDPYLIACHVLSLYCFWEGYNTTKKRYLLLMYGLLGLAMLAKGPVGVALPVITIILYLIFQKEWSVQNLRRLIPVSGLLITSLVAIPWFYLVHVRTHGAWTKGFFIQHNVNRFKDPLNGHKGPFILPSVFVLLGLFPFSVFLIRAISVALKQRTTNHWLFFNLIAAAVIVLAYSVSATKLINYTSPSYPFLATIIGYFFTQTTTHRLSSAKRLWPEWIALVIITISLVPAIYVMMRSEEAFRPIALLSLWLAVFPASVLAAIYFYNQWRIHTAFSTIAIGAVIATLIFFSVLFPALDKQGSVYKMKPLIQNGKPVIGYRSINDAFVFYHTQPIPILNAADSIAVYLKKDPAILVLERSAKASLPDSIPDLVIVASARDLFSHQYSFLYQLKHN
ncbi:ArnT family glycosyltransferase [Niastella sp. OAS944]|uniref:ArnT family glycosyltransferase n=1 Tax=Niastella sp. OAS944 TaxID=2664089 RepID=UPI003474D548|nr:4-amino-4-deoxy-L-arabinose transferase-like glycosyltransferase [Chitinophagaceae bacterium OAS944]